MIKELLRTLRLSKLEAATERLDIYREKILDDLYISSFINSPRTKYDKRRKRNL